MGLRDSNAALNQPEIICIGDSHTMGWGVEQEETFPKLLDGHLMDFVQGRPL